MRSSIFNDMNEKENDKNILNYNSNSSNPRKFINLYSGKKDDKENSKALGNIIQNNIMNNRTSHKI